jgi:hypothetical protein
MAKQHAGHDPADYKIKVKGKLGPEWSDWFEEMKLESEGNVTILTGKIVDQAALHGLLARIRDLGLPLVSVQRVELEQDNK